MGKSLRIALLIIPYVGSFVFCLLDDYGWERERERERGGGRDELTYADAVV